MEFLPLNSKFTAPSFFNSSILIRKFFSPPSILSSSTFSLVSDVTRFPQPVIANNDTTDIALIFKNSLLDILFLIFSPPYCLKNKISQIDYQQRWQFRTKSTRLN